MRKIKFSFADRETRNIVFAAISAVALALSLSGVLRDALPFDIAWIAIALCGVPIVIGSVTALVTEHDIKADVLVSIALIASVCIGAYFAAGEVAWIMAIGTLLEDATARKSRRGIEKLINLTPKTARIEHDGTEEIVPADDVGPGDILIVLAGETIAADGVILSGSTSVDQSVMTGESVPVDMSAGDEVMGGTVNCFGTFRMRVTKAGENSSLRRMIRLAGEADANKAPVVRLADRWATWLVAAALAFAFGAWLVTGLFIRAVTVLVVFCPCAFILATPTAVMAGIGNAARYGILVRSGDALQRFAKVSGIAFDKTGTLTCGRLEVIDVESFEAGLSRDALFRLAASAEQRSEHPLGKSIFTCYINCCGTPPESRDFLLVPGMGVHAMLDGGDVLVGKSDYLQHEGIEIPRTALKAAETRRSRGETVVFVSANGRFSGLIALADILRSSAKDTITELKGLGVHPVLLTGDNEATANHIASEAGIEDVRSNMLPEEKMAAIRAFEDGGEYICMVGDGVNDTVALKSAYAGIAMGGVGSDIAVESADAVLVGDNIENIPYLIRTARRSMKRIGFNIAVAMAWNVFAVALSAVGILTPVTAALVHNAGSVFVVISAATLIAAGGGSPHPADHSVNGLARGAVKANQREV